MEMYKENILDHYKNPRNKGKITDADYQHREPNPLCGDIVELFIKMGDDGKVSEVMFDGSGCAISQASVSILTEFISGKTLEELNAITTDKMLELLEVEVNPARLKCATLGLVAMQKALE